MSADTPLLQVRDLRVEFAGRGAVRGVSFDLFSGETVGLVGESGSGKSTLARAILRLLQPQQGSVTFMGNANASAARLRTQRRNLQVVFQDPLASLDPRMSVGAAVAEPLSVFEPGLSAAGLRESVAAMLERVGLSREAAARYPHEFSGGQCQRIAIARAMILKPKLLVCDEAVSSLDVSIQGQIVNLLLDLQRDSSMAMLFISHNLAVVRHLSHRVLVMYLGRLVEVCESEALFAAPLHPYTRALLAAVPRLPAVRVPASPAPPLSPAPPASPAPPLSPAPPASPAPPLSPAPPAEFAATAAAAGCAYRDRCPFALPLCAVSDPPLEEVSAGRFAACHRAREMLYPLS